MGTTDAIPYLTRIAQFSGRGHSVDEWNETVRQQFSPFVRRKSILTQNREILRTELVNLARILPHTGYVRLLRELVRLYRRAYYRDPAATADLLRDSLHEVTRASENWIGLFRDNSDRPPVTEPHDHVYRLFEQLDAILEGCFKPYLRVAHAFAAHDESRTFPANLHRKSFGSLLDHIRPALGKPGELLKADPTLAIPVNQWRNIAAHKSFSLVDRETIEVRWGSKQIETRQLPVAELDLILVWVMRTHAALRLASVIVFLEYMPEIEALGIPNVTLRAESWLVSLSHSLGIVGFEVVNWEGRDMAFRLSLKNRLDRSSTSALIHASQVLDQLALAVNADPTRRDIVKRVAVDLIDENGVLVASAELDTVDALAATRGELSEHERVEKTRFHFVNWDLAQQDLGRL